MLTTIHSKHLSFFCYYYYFFFLLLRPSSLFSTTPPPPPFVVTSLNLNPIETFFLRNRLDRIQSQTISRQGRGDYKFLKLLEETNTKDHDNLLQPPTAKNKDSLLSNLVLVLIFPGAGGPDSFTMELERNLMESLGGQQHQHQQHQDDNTKIEEECGSKFIVETLDWKQYRGSILSAAYDGEAFGEAIGELILQRYHESLQQRGETTMQQQQQQQEEEHQKYSPRPYYYIHLIGISVGAFAANACCSTLRRSMYDHHHQRLQQQQQQQQQHPKIYTRLTLLDPFTSRGIGGVGYGNANFGATADYAEHYLNTDDPVPSTNEPLDLCATWDVTRVPEREKEFVLPENETMHCWPVVYFARYVCQKSAGKVLMHGQDGAPERGSVTFL